MWLRSLWGMEGEFESERRKAKMKKVRKRESEVGQRDAEGQKVAGAVIQVLAGE